MPGRILLVSANKYMNPYPVYPIGLSFISTYLQDRFPEFEIRIFDFIHKDNSEYEKILVEFQPDYIGLSLRNIDDVNVYWKESFPKEYKEIIDLSRIICNATIIIGGAGYSIFPVKLFEFLKPDFGICGEGEESFYKLISSLENNTDYKHIEGLVYSLEKQIFLNSRKDFYVSPKLRFDDNIINFYWVDSGMLNIQSKRGCPFKCIYCTYPIIEGSHVRVLDIDNIIDSISEQYYRNGIDYFFFTDSVFNINNKYNYELAERIIASGIKIKWGGYFAPFNLDFDLLKLLKESGLTHIEFGTDSLSESQLEKYYKEFNVSDILKTSKLCNDLGIYFTHYLILGGIGESEQTLNETFENSKKIEKTLFYPFIGMRIYPGTKLEEIARKEHIIDENSDLLEPIFYVSDGIDLSTLKDRAKATGKKWVFPDEDMTKIVQKMRILDKKGPLWEYLIK